MEKLNENVSSDRLQTILNQLDNPIGEPQRIGEFVPTFQEDMFDQSAPEPIPLRKEFVPTHQNGTPNSNPIGIKSEPAHKPMRRLFDYQPVEVPNLDQQLSLR